MALLTITTPRGTLSQTRTRGGTVRSQLVWSPDFARQRTQMFGRVQSFVDSETVRLMQPYTPLRTGMLVKSATLGTVIGSGKIRQIVPYAAKQYYDTAATRSYDPRRGAQWFERMKIDHRVYILRGAAREAGARYRE